MLITKTGPILLGYDVSTSVDGDSPESWRDLPRHKDEDQVELDVNRSFIYYPKSTQINFPPIDLKSQKMND